MSNYAKKIFPIKSYTNRTHMILPYSHETLTYNVHCVGWFLLSIVLLSACNLYNNSWPKRKNNCSFLGKEDGAVFIWSTWIYPVLLILFGIVIICLVWCLPVKIQDYVNRNEIPPGRNPDVHARSGDGGEHAQAQEENIELHRAS